MRSRLSAQTRVGLGVAMTGVLAVVASVAPTAAFANGDSASGYQLTVVAGTGSQGSATPSAGPALSAALNQPRGVAVDSSGNVFVADSGSNAIEKLTPNGDGTYALSVLNANLTDPVAVAVDVGGDVYVADEDSNVAGDTGQALYQLQPDGTGGYYQRLVIAGSRFSSVAVNSLGWVYATNATDGSIVKAIPNGGSYLSSTDATVNGATGLAFDRSNNLFVSTQDSVIELPTAGGQRTVASGLRSPRGLSVDAAGNVFIAESGTGAIDEAVPSVDGSTYSVTALAGLGAPGAPTEGAALSSALGGVTDVTLAPSGALFVADPTNQVVERLSTVPRAPWGVWASAMWGSPGSGSVNLEWNAPGDGGSPIIGYTVTATDTSDGGATSVVCSNILTTACKASGLVNGSAYTFTVSAANAIGSGPDSVASDPVTPATQPDAPTDLAAVASSQAVTLSWTAPAYSGGAPITGYVVTLQDVTAGGQPVTLPTSVCGNGTATGCTISSLTNGHRYSFTVAAANWAGAGSADSASATPSGTPDQIVGVAADAGDAFASVAWSAPNDEGAPITGYVVTATDHTSSTTSRVCAASSTSPATSCDATGLINGHHYSFEVDAINGDGTGTGAPSNTVTPMAGTWTSATVPTTATFGRGFSIPVEVSSTGTPSGIVVAKSGSIVLGSATLTKRYAGDYVATIKVPPTCLAAGPHPVIVYYQGNAAASPSSTFQTPARVWIAKATSTTSAALLAAVVSHRVHAKVAVVVTAPGLIPIGTVAIYSGSTRIATTVLVHAQRGRVTVTLPLLRRGRYRLTVRYVGTSNVKPSVSKVLVLTSS